MIRFFKSLFGGKVEEPKAPYKVEAPAQESAPAPAVVAEPGKEVTSVASKPANTPAPAKKQGGGKKPATAKKQGGNKPRKPKAPKQPKAQ